MDNSQLIAMMTQYAQQGKDASTLLNDYQALASAGKTPLGLNQWVKSDKPMMEDFNEDNRIVDERLRALTSEKADQTYVDQQLNGFKFYGNLSELDATASSTMLDVAGKMIDRSILYATVDAPDTLIYPYRYGVIEIVRLTSNRIKAVYRQLISNASPTSVNEWHCNITVNTSTWSGWRQVQYV